MGALLLSIFLIGLGVLVGYAIAKNESIPESQKQKSTTELVIGEKYALEPDNPFQPYVTTILNIKDGYVEYGNSKDYTQSKSIKDFKQLYTKI